MSAIINTVEHNGSVPDWLVIDGVSPNQEVLHFRAKEVNEPFFNPSVGNTSLFTSTERLNGVREFIIDEGHYGIAAPQLGVSKRWFYLNEEKFELSDKTHKGMFINPSFRGLGPARWKRESCLSVPNESHRVRRHDIIIAQWQSMTPMTVVIGETTCADHINPPGYYQCRMIGKLAQAFQHECDHLNGRLINQKKRR